MPVAKTTRTENAGAYAMVWIALLAMYALALAANGLTAGLAIRNAVANLLPDALLGLAVLRCPMVLRWPVGAKSRFFLTHGALIVAFVLLATGGWIALVALDSLLFAGRVSAHINVRIVPFRVVYDVLIYSATASFAYARQNAAELHQQAERAVQAEALRAQASLEAMRSQLNPHFILNTFHALLGLVRRDPETAERAIERLGDLLRHSLRMQRDGIDEVPLADECELVSNYLELEQLRLGARLRTSIDVPAPISRYLVPTFALQILVENAVRHAIAPRAAGGLLLIRAELRDQVLRLVVSDEPAGETVLPGACGSKLGLRLLEDRLSALYAGTAKLTIETLDSGTRALIELPAREAPQEEP